MVDDVRAVMQRGTEYMREKVRECVCDGRAEAISNR